jgi:hypothetical protein
MVIVASGSANFARLSHEGAAWATEESVSAGMPKAKTNIALVIGRADPKRTGRSTTTPLCGCAGGCVPSTKSGDAVAGPIHSRTFTGTSGSSACAGLGTTCRGRRRDVSRVGRNNRCSSMVTFSVLICHSRCDSLGLAMPATTESSKATCAQSVSASRTALDGNRPGGARRA